jgi:murein DD-endopeptidase MepM/ murein hydrolase activator NlpD
MKRVLLLAALFAPMSSASADSIAPEPGPIETFARAALSFDPALEHIANWKAGLDELLQSTSNQLATLLPAPIPDISVLTTQPIPQTLSSGYGWRDDPIRHTWRFHSGTDFPADYGTPVLAAGPGKVIFAGRYSGYGNCVQIDHGNGVVTLYGHMRRIETKKDAILAAGERLGQVGSTGRATGPHLHFEIRLDNRPVDPVMAMSIAEVWRTSATAGHIAAYQLSPELQKKARAYSDRRDGPRPERPERKGAPTRTQALW